MSLTPSSIVSAPLSAFGWLTRSCVPAATALLALAAALAGCQGGDTRPATQPTAATPDLSAYRLGIGDRLRISVFGEPDLSLEADIDATGHLSYPLLGSVPAAKKTASQLAADLAKGLASGYLKNPDVRVSVVQYRSIYVTGQVNRAGAYPYSVGLTVEKALTLAGGMTRIASERGIYLLPEDAPSSQRRRARLDEPVLPGDTIVVEESLF
jgi:protein involved in polysaccharide export with SLBB domain